MSISNLTVIYHSLFHSIMSYGIIFWRKIFTEFCVCQNVEKGNWDNYGMWI